MLYMNVTLTYYVQNERFSKTNGERWSLAYVHDERFSKTNGEHVSQKGVF
jgi:hypothetical protein